MQRNEISENEFNSFIKEYLEKFNLPVDQNILIGNLTASKLIALDNFGNYCFCYQYLYYFFVAKYLAENIDENEYIINKLIRNLHKDENAYIAIFMSHHTKDDYILDEIIVNALVLFDQYKPASLSKEELSFFDQQADSIIKAVLPSTTPEVERDNRLSVQNIVEQNNKNLEKNIPQDKEEDDVSVGIRRSIKTVEVMGHVIKNRAGSLDKTRLESIFEEAMNVHLRILTSFFEYIQSESEQEEIVNFLSDRLALLIEKDRERRREIGRKKRDPTREELKEMSKDIFWNVNFFVVYGFIHKIINSIGSNQLTQVAEQVCDEIDTPASFLVKHGILMWYAKNLQVENISGELDKNEFSYVAKRIMKFIIVNHCSMHKVGYKEKQKIENEFGISKKKLLTLPSSKVS